MEWPDTVGKWEIFKQGVGTKRWVARPVNDAPNATACDTHPEALEHVIKEQFKECVQQEPGKALAYYILTRLKAEQRGA